MSAMNCCRVMCSPLRQGTTPYYIVEREKRDALCVTAKSASDWNEALPQTDEVYAEDGALIAIANDRWTPIEPAGTMP